MKLGSRHSTETKRKISEAGKNRAPISEETRRKMSEAHRNPSEEIRRKISEGNKNRPRFSHSDEARRKISDANKRRVISEETRRKMSESHKGNQNLLGHNHTDEARRKISEATKGKNNPNWQGGISFGKYCPKFNEEFKEKIREKYNRKCFLCSKTEVENGRKLGVHHVNYDKKCLCVDIECEFVPLCVNCHMKTNGKRIHWEAVITGMLNNPSGQLCLDKWY